MSPDLSQVGLAWDSNYRRKQDVVTFRLLKSLAALVESQMASP